MERFAFYKSLYDTELKRIDELDKAINNPILFITILFGVISYISERLNFENLTTMDYIILFLVVLVSLILIKSVYHIVLSYNNGIKGYDYEILESIIKYEEYYKALIRYNQELRIQDNDREFSESIIEELVECADFNSKVNINRTYQLFLSKKYLVIASIISFVLFIIHLLNQLL